ncbi:ABC transporter ATP-binding protein [Ascidiimonas aurantiaca]|uniref:ABC transporter ATP-binding protein n=1 Tax=Ascidiimonas aurantiaca TaxID=1685432 RepID=UPI0030ECDE62
MNLTEIKEQSSSSVKNPALLEFRKVEKTYRLGNQSIKALKGINLSIEHGEFLAIAGPSGSGKSTLLNLVSLIDTPTSGSVRYNDVNVGSFTDKAITAFRNRKIGIVFQNYNLIPVLSAEENVAFALQVQQDTSYKNSLNEARAILNEVGLGGHLRHRPANLSGGQQQRVAIARALVTSPEIVVADEPTSALDTKTGMEIIDLMQKLNETKRTTFVFSTHDPRVIKRVNYVINLEDGHIVNESNKNQ